MDLGGRETLSIRPFKNFINIQWIKILFLHQTEFKMDQKGLIMDSKGLRIDFQWPKKKCFLTTKNNCLVKIVTAY